MSYRRGARALALLITVSLSSVLNGAEVEGVPPKDARARLEAGNARYANAKVNPRKYSSERPALASGQTPYATLLSCSDSRVPPELVFDESLGKLFVVRLAGNIADADAVGTLEYGAEHLGSRLIVVLGHSSCGAVDAAVSGAQGSSNLNGLLKEIKPAVDAARASAGEAADKKSLVAAATQENVRLQMKNILERSEVLKDLVAKGRVEIVGGVYDLKTGKVDWIQAR